MVGGVAIHDEENIDPDENIPPTAGCSCVRIQRAGWTAQDLTEWPVGVFEVSSHGTSRYHATFGARAGGQWTHLGCFAIPGKAASAWDGEARRRGWTIVNSPSRPGEESILEAIRQRGEFAERAGFPHAPSDTPWRLRQLDSVLQAAAGVDSLWSDDGLAVQQRDHWIAPGNLLCFSCNPHGFDTRKARGAGTGWMELGQKPSACEWFASGAVNRTRAVRSLVERCGDANGPGGGATYASGYAAALRREVCFLSGAWVLNFQPLVAAAIYRRFAPSENAVIYDPCAGWGGRLLGAACAGNVRRYLACEPSAATHDGLTKLAALVKSRKPALEVELLRRGAEDTPLDENSVDLVFTSPPYFCLELYTARGESHGEGTQSHVRYPEASWWVSQFLGRLITHSHTALKPGGCLLLNVANNRMLNSGGLDLEGAVCDLCEKAGLVREPTLRMLKPRAPGASEGGATSACGGCAWEPIFVFRKKAAVAPDAEERGEALGELLGAW